MAKWDALDLEEAIITAKGTGGMVRTAEEWARHPQAVTGQRGGLPVEIEPW